jgi:hypothetical protein
LSKLAGNRQKIARDLRKLAVDVRERVGERRELRNPREFCTDVRCKRFSCQKPLAEILHGFEEARCPFEDELGEFEAGRGSFEEPLREGRRVRILAQRGCLTSG